MMQRNYRQLNRALNAFLILMVLAAPVVIHHGYSKWVKMEEARRGQ